MDDRVLQFRRGVEGAAHEAPWVLVFRDGRLEQRGLSDGETPGAALSLGTTTAELVERALRLAQRVLSSEMPTRAGARGPTDTLELVIFEGGVSRASTFRWAQATERDAALEPVPGERPSEDLDALRTLLNLFAWQSGRRGLRPVTPDIPAARVRAEARSIEETIQRLIESPPARLSDLERVIGSSSFCSLPHDAFGWITRPPLEAPASARFSNVVIRISVQCAFDPHHERPYSLDDGRLERDPALLHFSLGFAVDRGPSSPRNPVGQVLDRIGGPAVALDESPLGPGRRYGSFFCFEPGDNLSWYAALPDWAQPRSPVEVRSRWLAELAASLRAGCGHDELSAFFEALPEGLGVRHLGAQARDDHHFVFEPRMEALAFCRAIGLDEALALSGDTHAQNWEIHVTGGPADVHRHVLPRLGSWVVEATLDGRPRPLDEDGVRAQGFPPIHDLQHCAPSRVGPVRIAPSARPSFSRRGPAGPVADGGDAGA